MVELVELVASVRSRWGNSSVATPVGFRSCAIPPTKSLTSGTWARTLLPAMRSAERPSATRRAASSRPKNSTSVGTPAATAFSATLGAGSIPSTGTPIGRKCWRR